MKRWLCSFFLAVGVVFLLWIPHRSVRPHLHPQATANRSVLSQNEFVSTRRALQAASPTFPRSRVGPVEFFAPAFGFLITDIADDDALPWLDYRGPPGPNACNQGLVTGCKAARQVGSLTGSTFQRNSGPRRANLKHGVLQHALARRLSQHLHYILSGVSIPSTCRALMSWRSTSSVRPSRNARFCSSASDRMWCLW